MPIYQMISGEYEDKGNHGILEGPDDPPWQALYTEWVSDATINLTQDRASQFVGWLAEQPGWKSLESAEIDVDGLEDYGRELRNVENAFHYKHGHLAGVCPKNTINPSYTHHYLDLVRNADGTKHLICRLCGEDRKVG